MPRRQREKPRRPGRRPRGRLRGKKRKNWQDRGRKWPNKGKCSSRKWRKSARCRRRARPETKDEDDLALASSHSREELEKMLADDSADMKRCWRTDSGETDSSDDDI